jgi:hypothetical protein
MRVNGSPSVADLAKGGVPSDGVGPHDHTGFAPHEHGEPSYTDEQVAFLEQRGYHCDRHHGQVLDADGDVVPPGLIGPMLLDAKQRGVLKAVMGEDDMMMTWGLRDADRSPGGLGTGRSATDRAACRSSCLMRLSNWR